MINIWLNFLWPCVMILKVCVVQFFIIAFCLVDDVVNELLTKEIRLQKFIISQAQANIVLQSQDIASSNISSDKWIVDSGVTNHMSYHFSSIVSQPQANTILLKEHHHQIYLLTNGSLIQVSLIICHIIYLFCFVIT